jgi:hypothetical protein
MNNMALMKLDDAGKAGQGELIQLVSFMPSGKCICYECRQK